MSKYRVFYIQREVRSAIVEADSTEELADTDFGEFDWEFCDDTLTGDILIGETEEVDD